MKNNLSSTGLSPETIKKIHHVFASYLEIDQVCLYGSRAKGNYRDGSDIDLSILGDALSVSKLLTIESELDDLLLPYKIDLCLFRQIENKNLIEHIQRVGVDFYCRKKIVINSGRPDTNGTLSTFFL